jgi:polyisoprenoid-binding protein YceI
MMFSAWKRFPSLRNNVHKKIVLAVCAISVSWNVAATAQPRSIDTGKSTVTVRVYKAGVFSALGHDHEIAAPITRGVVNTAARRVELEVKANALQVRDPGTSEKDRAEIQSTMLGPQVLDTEQYQEITFRSTEVQPTGPDSWNVQGNLALHGENQAVGVLVHEVNGHYVGTSRFKQTDFGIKPVKIAGGTIRVKDEIRIDFDIQLAQ